jgi:hypothetical protein
MTSLSSSLTLFTLLSTSAVLACACASSGGASDPVDITGTWLLCDTAAQAGQSDHPGGGNYVRVGGEILDVTVQQGIASASEVGGDGGPVSESIGWLTDSGVACDGGSCGETNVLLSGPFDPTSRVWTAGFLWPHETQYPTIVETYPALLTFSADGTRFTGIMDDGSGAQVSWFGGRDDGTFTCSSGSGGGSSGSGGRCTGSAYACDDVSPPDCGNILGCYMDIGVAGPDYCSGSAEPCADIGGQEQCAQQGCTWSQ